MKVVWSGVVGTRELVIPDTPYFIPYRVRRDRLELIAITSQRTPAGSGTRAYRLPFSLPSRYRLVRNAFSPTHADYHFHARPQPVED